MSTNVVMVLLYALSCSFHLCNLILLSCIVLVVSFFKSGGMWYIGLFIVCMSFPVIPLLISERI